MEKTSGGIQAYKVGPTRSAGPSINVLRPGGTKHMVARGFWRQIKTRWRSRNAAFIQVFVRKQRT
jgi:hypothetical protein